MRETRDDAKNSGANNLDPGLNPEKIYFSIVASSKDTRLALATEFVEKLQQAIDKDTLVIFEPSTVDTVFNKKEIDIRTRAQAVHCLIQTVRKLNMFYGSENNSYMRTISTILSSVHLEEKPALEKALKSRGTSLQDLEKLLEDYEFKIVRIHAFEPGSQGFDKKWFAFRKPLHTAQAALRDFITYEPDIYREFRNQLFTNSRDRGDMLVGSKDDLVSSIQKVAAPLLAPGMTIIVTESISSKSRALPENRRFGVLNVKVKFKNFPELQILEIESAENYPLRSYSNSLSFSLHERDNFTYVLLKNQILEAIKRATSTDTDNQDAQEPIRISSPARPAPSKPTNPEDPSLNKPLFFSRTTFQSGERKNIAMELLDMLAEGTSSHKLVYFDLTSAQHVFRAKDISPQTKAQTIAKLIQSTLKVEAGVTVESEVYLETIRNILDTVQPEEQSEFILALTEEQVPIDKMLDQLDHYLHKVIQPKAFTPGLADHEAEKWFGLKSPIQAAIAKLKQLKE